MSRAHANRATNWYYPVMPRAQANTYPPKLPVNIDCKQFRKKNGTAPITVSIKIERK